MKRSVLDIILMCGSERDYDFLDHSTPNSIAEEIDDFLYNDDDNYRNLLTVKAKKIDIVRWVEEFLEGENSKDLVVATGIKHLFILTGRKI